MNIAYNEHESNKDKEPYRYDEFKYSNINGDLDIQLELIKDTAQRISRCLNDISDDLSQINRAFNNRLESSDTLYNIRRKYYKYEDEIKYGHRRILVCINESIRSINKRSTQQIMDLTELTSKIGVDV